MNELQEKIRTRLYDKYRLSITKPETIEIINICMDAAIGQQPGKYTYAEYGYECGWNDGLNAWANRIESLKVNRDE